MNWADYPIKETKNGDKNYPEILAKIDKAPKKLYYRGSLTNSLFKKSLAVVGSRKMTRYGMEVIDKLVSGLVGQKVTIISGFMYGVDTLAHKKCLEYGGTTVAVFGSGLDICYPPENKKLYDEILANGGAVLSEYRPDMKPQLWTFPQRNRIVAGLAALGVLVIEGGEKSGSLITANFAKKYGRKVYAVPGPITSTASAGTNMLIKEGVAELVAGASDILGKKIKQEPLPFELEPFEKKIYKALLAEPSTVDELAAAVGANVVELNKALSLMSLKGAITESAGKFYPTKA
jgi:DNA processing protein